MQKCDGVFVGGGVKGIGFAGAVEAMDQAGYTFENVVGTSAGAIAAALVAAGYTGRELGQVLEEVDYAKFRQPMGCGRLGPLGDAVNVVRRYGVYSSDYFAGWLRELLAAKGVRTFGDLRTPYPQEAYRYKFQAVASDISAQRMLVLPGDLRQFGMEPDSFEVAQAVRMSMSIPFFYEPTRLICPLGLTHWVADGGLLSNYPVWLLDDGSSDPPWPTFGFKFDAGGTRPCKALELDNVVEYAKGIVSTLLDGHDNYYISTTKGDFQRSVMIPTQVETGGEKKVIGTTYFDITREESRALYQNGYRAAKTFLQTWSFAAWKRRFRGGQAMP